MIAIIAGTGNLPIEASKFLHAHSMPFFIISLFPEDNGQYLEQLFGKHIEIIAQDCYKPNEILSLLKNKATKQVLLVGKVDKRHLLKKVKLDWLAIKILGSLIAKSDKNIMEAILAEFTKHNIEVLRQDSILNALLVPPGILSGSLTPELSQDIAMGMKAALAIAHADIGQTVVVKDGMILAVEAIEGTDACIQRGIEFGKQGIVICKTARTDQNRKFDLPTLGPNSLAPFKKGQVSVLAWHSHCTLIVQKEELVKKASELDITLVSISSS